MNLIQKIFHTHTLTHKMIKETSKGSIMESTCKCGYVKTSYFNANGACLSIKEDTKCIK